MLRHSIESGHNEVSEVDFQVIGKGYRHNSRRRKIAEALFIKDKRPSLNIQEKSIPLQLFNWQNNIVYCYVIYITIVMCFPVQGCPCICMVISTCGGVLHIFLTKFQAIGLQFCLKNPSRHGGWNNGDIMLFKRQRRWKNMSTFFKKSKKS